MRPKFRAVGLREADAERFDVTDVVKPKGAAQKRHSALTIARPPDGGETAVAVAENQREMSATDAKNESRFLTVGETARRLNVSPATIYRRVQEGQLPAIRVGVGVGPIRIDRHE